MVFDGENSSGFAVLDFETTGFNRDDRIVEIGVALLNAKAEIEKYWRTLVQPNRGFDNSDIHHVFPSDLVGAPQFEQIARRFALLLNNRILVAHNAPFERRFLENEFGRVGLQLPRSNWIIDTQSLSRDLLPGSPRRLSDCLDIVGVENLAAHTALADAVATGQLFGELLSLNREILESCEPLRFSVDQLRSLPESSVPLVARADGLFLEATADNTVGTAVPVTAISSTTGGVFDAESEWLRRLTQSVPDTGDELSDRYAAFLAKAMVDGELSEEELEQLSRVATEYGLTSEDVSELHEHYLKQLVIEAWADGVLTNRERFWLGRIADELSIDQSRFLQLLMRPSAGSEQELGSQVDTEDIFALSLGDRVTFTGAMVTPRESWESRARKAGLDVGGVIKSSRVLVAADVNTMSGKAKKARRLGIAIIDEVTFARAFAALTSSASEVRADDQGSVVTGAHTAAPMTMPRAGELFDESNTIAPIETLREVFPWLQVPEPVVPVRGDTVGIVEAWLSGHETTQLVEMSPYLNPTMRPESTPWERAMVLLGASKQSGITDISADQLAKLPGIGRVRLQKLVSEVVLLALDEHETNGLIQEPELDTSHKDDTYLEFEQSGQIAVDDSPSLDASALLDWIALTGTANRVVDTSVAVPQSVIAAVEALKGHENDVISRASGEVSDVVAADPRNAAIVDKRFVGGASLEELGQQFGVTRERIRQLEAQLRKALLSIGPNCDLVKAAIGARVGKATRIRNVEEALPALAMPPAGLETELFTLLPLVGEEGSFGVEFSDQWVTEKGFAKSVEDSVSACVDEYGVAPLDQVAARVGASEALVQAWIEEQAPHTIRDGKVFTETESVPEEAKGLYLRDGEWQLLQTITKDHIRGSGTGIDRGIAALYDVPFGESVMIPSRLGEQRISWGKTNTAIGTISRFTQDLGLVEGDRVWLHFGAAFDVTRAPALREDYVGLAKVINRFGLDDEFLTHDGQLLPGVTSDVVLAAINLSMNLPADSNRRKTVRRLWARRDDELAALVREL